MIGKNMNGRKAVLKLSLVHVTANIMRHNVGKFIEIIEDGRKREQESLEDMLKRYKEADGEAEKIILASSIDIQRGLISGINLVESWLSNNESRD